MTDEKFEGEAGEVSSGGQVRGRADGETLEREQARSRDLLAELMEKKRRYSAKVADAEDSAAKARKEAEKARERDQKELSPDEVKEAIEEVQSKIDAIGKNLMFGLSQDAKTESVIVQITERRTGELIRQFPAEDLLALKASLEELTGLLFDQEA